MSNLLEDLDDGGKQLATELTINGVDAASIGGSKYSRMKQILRQQFAGLAPSKDPAVSLSGPRFVTIFTPFNKFGLRFERVVYDRDTISVSGFHLPLFLDMVKDNAKNRLLNVLSFACIFCSVILILSSFLFVSPQPSIPSQVQSCCCSSQYHGNSRISSD